MAPSWVQLLRLQIDEVGSGDVANRLIVDVREFSEYAKGTVPDAICIPLGRLKSAIEDQAPDKTTPILLVCNVGERSAVGAMLLEQLGYHEVASLRDGFEGWRAEGRPVSEPRIASSNTYARYERHIILPGVGERGQQKLLESKVLIAGMGGLGSPAAIYLAAAGVGTIGLVDFDVVDVTNLQRQIVHTTDRIGEPKVESARAALAALNPDVDIVPHQVRLDSTNVLGILSAYDLIIDATDNFPTRYLLNDASLHLRIPVIHGSIFRFEGQVSVFSPYEGPCYRCLFREPPPPELAPSCAEAGVFGVLPGVIGSIQATEAIKVLLGIGDPLIGRLLLYDALDQEFRSVNLRRDPSCPACADEHHPPKIVDYDGYCIPAGTVVRPQVHGEAGR